MQLSELQKFEIIVKHNQGLSIRQIARSMNINKNTVNMWILRYANEKNLNKKKKSGKFKTHLNNL
jgi:transposase